MMSYSENTGRKYFGGGLLTENQQNKSPLNRVILTSEKAEEKKIVPALMDGPHPLHNSWVFWYIQNKKGIPWEDNLKILKKVTTVEEFWGVMHTIKNPTEIQHGCSYALFKAGLKPMWEDEGNRRGGRWLITFERRNRHMLDDKWLEVLMCLIGEAFGPEGEDICGVVVDLRPKGDKINVWTKDCQNRSSILHIGNIIKDRLQLNVFDSYPAMVFERHVDTQHKNTRGPMLTL